MSKATRSTDAVQVRFARFGEIEVDHNIDGLDVDTAREQIRRDQVPGRAVAELVKDAVAVGLLHLGVDVVARVAELGDLLGQKFDAIDRIAENDALVDLELGEESVEAVNLLALFDVRVELRDAPQREFIHEVDAVRVGDVIFAERLDRDGKRRAEKTDLVVVVAETDDLFEDGLEFGRQ